jgi:hypothetical protein
MRLRRFIRRAREIWAEMDYAQRRLFELRMALPPDEREDPGPPRAGERPMH